MAQNVIDNFINLTAPEPIGPAAITQAAAPAESSFGEHLRRAERVQVPAAPAAPPLSLLSSSSLFPPSPPSISSLHSTSTDSPFSLFPFPPLSLFFLPPHFSSSSPIPSSLFPPLPLLLSLSSFFPSFPTPVSDSGGSPCVVKMFLFSITIDSLPRRARPSVKYCRFLILKRVLMNVSSKVC